jgi:hypothetical protein
MPLADADPASAWALPGLEMYLQKGDVYMAQQFAYDVADVYGQDFPHPLDLPALNPQPEYYFGYGVSEANLPSLEAVKTWMEGAERRFDTLTVGEYGTYDEAAVDERELEARMEQQGLQAAMNLAEKMAVTGGYLDPERTDPRIFFEDDAPADPFTTIRQEQLEIQSIQHPYWRMETLPVNTPDGEPLGHALHIVVYPHVEHDLNAVGSPAISEDEPFRLLEMVHFETTEAADKFGEEFRGYLMPGLLEAPELAVEVARLEGLPVEWKTLQGDDLTAYRNAELTLTRDPVSWHPYNPHAERDARIEAEGLYTDLIQQTATQDFDL